MKRFFMFMVLIIMPTVLLAGETDDLKKELEGLRKQREELENSYLRDKYIFIDEKQKARDELSVIEGKARELLERRNRVKEDIQALKKERAEIAEKNELNAMSITETYSSFISLTDKVKSFVKMHAPITKDADLQKITELRRDAEDKKNIQSIGISLIDFMIGLIDMSKRSAIFDDDILTEKGELVRGKRIQIGGIFYGYLTADGKTSAILLRAGGLSAGEYRWNTNAIDASSIDKFIAALNGKSSFTVLPLDVLQSQATEKSLAGGSSVFGGFIAWFKAGGIVMYAILIVFFMACFIIIERIRIFRKNHLEDIDPEPVLAQLKGGHPKEALLLCAEKQGPRARLFETIVKEKRHSADDDYAQMQEIMLKEIPQLDKRLTTLKSLGALAPLLGLLGTVTGMISLFDVITAVGSGDPKLLAGGISEALITTEFGLIVAIPTVLAHRLLQNKAESIINELERCGLAALNLISVPKKK